MTKYDIHMDKLKGHGDEIKKTAQNALESNIRDIIRLSNEIAWEGPSHDVFISTFNEIMKNVCYIPSVIGAYGKFMVTASGGFNEINDKMYDDLLKEMDKNDKRFSNLKTNNVKKIPTELVIKEKYGGEYDEL